MIDFARSTFYTDSFSNLINRFVFEKKFIFLINISYLSGEPILPHLLCYNGFAVKYHSCIHCALHLRQPRLVNNPSLNMSRNLYNMIDLMSNIEQK